MSQSYKYYRFYLDHEEKRDNSKLSLELRKITGLSVDDYIKPVVAGGGEIVCLLSDESTTKDFYSVSIIITKYKWDDEFQSLEGKLEKLLSKYNIRHIHFPKIFGRTEGSLNPQQRRSFAVDYYEAVKDTPLACLSFTQHREDLKKISESNSDNDLFLQLFLNAVQHTIAPFPQNSIFHIYREQTLDLGAIPTREQQLRLIMEHTGGINAVLERSDKYFSFCKHPQYFTKRALFPSSVSDLAAYSSSVIENQLERRVPTPKIIKNNRILLRLVKRIFTNYSGFSNSYKQILDKVIL